MVSFPQDQVQNVDDDAASQAMADCMCNPVIVRKILEFFSTTELLQLSLVNKMWIYEARSVMRKRGNLFVLVRCTDAKSGPENFEAILAATQEMNIVPFSGINIHVCQACPNGAPASFYDITLDQLQFKKVAVDLVGEYDDCPGFLLAKKVLQDFSQVLEELSLHISAKEQKNIVDVVQECRFPHLKILKLREFYDNQDEAHTSNMRELVSRAPRLQELHTEEPIDSVFDALQGSSAAIVYTPKVLAPFDDVMEAAIGALRLEKMQLFHTDREFNFERFSRMAPALLQASCTTVRSMWIDAVLAVPLMCYGVCLENVKHLEIHMNHRQLELFGPEILGIFKNFDFTRIFPNVRKVKFLGDYSTVPSLLHEVRIIQRANATLTDPKPDRAAKVKELHLDECDLSNTSVQFFAEMFPNIEKLEVDDIAEDRIPFESIWKHWVYLKELKFVGRIIQNYGNLDSVFCGIFPEEVEELRQKDEEYLKSVNIVPVMPAVTCLKNLRVLSMNRVGLSREPYVDDGTFMFSKVTGLIAFARCPALAVSLDFCLNRGVMPATSHLKSFMY